MRIAIVDDFPADRTQLQTDILTWAAETGTLLPFAPRLYESGEAFLSALTEDTYDIIFLDIYMQGINGMDTAKRIREHHKSCSLIFVSSSTEFAVESYDVESTYYLVKPYPYEKLCLALNRCNTSLQKKEEMIYIPTKSGKEKLYIHDIAYTEYANRHVTVYMKNGNSRLIAARQLDFVDALSKYPYFCDCMKGVMVNFEAVEQLQKDRFLLKNGRFIPISRLKYQGIREQYLEYSYAKIREG